MRIIGLTGRARAGKDTVARLLIDHLADRHVIREGFADALKLSAARALGFDGPLAQCIEFCDALKTGTVLTTTPKGTRTISGREFLQRYGTESHRDVFGSDFWIDAVLPAGRDDCDVLVVSDVRFENEAERIRDRGGEVWRITRPSLSTASSHPSEAGLPDHLVDLEIGNAGTLDDLRNVIARGWRN